MKRTPAVIAGLSRNPLKFLILNFSFLILLVACSEDKEIGSISFTSNQDCDIRLFDSHGRQVAREQYEVGKAPAVVQMKSSGVFVIHAESQGQVTKKEPITYVTGNMEHYIEF
jgi:hypothetical protein